MRVDYYLLDQSAPQVIVDYTCRLLSKAYDAGLRVFVLAESPEQCVAIDQHLWVSSDSNFIPHSIAGSNEASAALTKICIGAELPAASGYDFLVSLQHKDNIEGADFARVAELVSSDEAHKQAARKRYAAWRDQGAELNLHNIKLH